MKEELNYEIEKFKELSKKPFSIDVISQMIETRSKIHLLQQENQQ